MDISNTSHRHKPMYYKSHSLKNSFWVYLLLPVSEWNAMPMEAGAMMRGTESQRANGLRTYKVPNNLVGDWQTLIFNFMQEPVSCRVRSPLISATFSHLLSQPLADCAGRGLWKFPRAFLLSSSSCINNRHRPALCLMRRLREMRRRHHHKPKVKSPPLFLHITNKPCLNRGGRLREVGALLFFFIYTFME